MKHMLNCSWFRFVAICGKLSMLTALWKCIESWRACAGVLPWAAATHCAFGLWMHTHFYGGSDKNVSDLADKSGNGLSNLARSKIGQRITQLNGLPLLVLLAVHATIHVIIR
eukprot:GHRQ01039394.1.p1 GENE.GHRQ01039394.1~~GHRQ01039394.1.p1  ORF type:complete len:112 (-),score=24.72 GHRQ01039394.1:159-494(-)